MEGLLSMGTTPSSFLGMFENFKRKMGILIFKHILNMFINFQDLRHQNINLGLYNFLEKYLVSEF